MAVSCLQNNLDFSSLFPVNSKYANDLYRNAINKFELQVDFNDIKENCENLIRKYKAKVTGPEGSKIINVPANGDCSVNALLAPILGFVLDRKVINIYNLLLQSYGKYFIRTPKALFRDLDLTFLK